MKLPSLIGLLLVAGLLASCGFGRMATGVVVWAPDGGTVKNGDIVWIWEQSRIRRSFKVQTTTGGGAFETDQWRVQSFASEKEAQDFSAQFLTLKDVWAVSGKQGLPVREAADANANRVYKLGEQEEVKVLARGANRVKQGNLEGTWVQVLTKDGYSGWVFDYYLTLVDKSKGTGQSVKPSGPGDENVQLIAANTWYPEEMRFMVDQDRLIPEQFRADLGLRLIPSADGAPSQTFLLTLASEAGPDESFELVWEEPRKIDATSYWFGGPQKLRIQFLNPELNKISVVFNWKGQEHSAILTLLGDNVGTYLSRELASRQQKWSEIKTHGSTLTSPTYGTMTLGDDGQFTWDGFEALQPPAGDLLPAGIPHTGAFVFDWFKDRKYTGEFRAVRLVFGGEPEAASQVFLYRFLKDGMQLLPVAVRDSDPAKRTVLRESKSVISLFLNFQP